MSTTGVGDTLFTDGSIHSSFSRWRSAGPLPNLQSTLPASYGVSPNRRWAPFRKTGGNLRLVEATRGWKFYTFCAALPFRSHASFDLQSMRANFADSAHEVLVPCVAVHGAHSTQDMVAAEVLAALRQGRIFQAFGARGAHSYPRPIPIVGDFAVPPFCKGSC